MFKNVSGGFIVGGSLWFAGSIKFINSSFEDCYVGRVMIRVARAYEISFQNITIKNSFILD